MMNLHKKLIALILAGVIAGGSASFAFAASKPAKKQGVDQIDSDTARPVNEDTRLAVFNYNSDLAYEILTREGLYTHIELPPGEKVQGFYPSDTSRWRHHVAGNQERIFMKPTLPGLFNSATLVTSKRVYELTFRSGKSGDAWYQRVRWSGEGDEGAGAESFEPQMSAQRFASPAVAPSQMPFGDPLEARPSSFRPDSPVGGPSVSPAALNFAYVVTGEAAFKPAMVFDDGKFTWVQMGNRPEMPALFNLKKDGKVEVVNYTVHGSYLKVSQLVDGLLLKLGPEEIKVTRKPACTGFMGC